MSYKMKHKKSSFPFKGSPVKRYRPNPLDMTEQEERRREEKNWSHHRELMDRTIYRGMRRRGDPPPLTSEDYLEQGLNKWGGTDMDI